MTDTPLWSEKPAPNFQKACRAQESLTHKSDTILCTRELGHPGDHVAHGREPGTTEILPLVRWNDLHLTYFPGDWARTKPEIAE